MLSNNSAIEFKNIWKKYSRSRIFHRSLREDLSNIFCQTKQENELHKDEFWALQNINFQIKKGETVGFWGGNGAGKSTILKMIANITYPSRGSLIAQGKIAPLLEIGAGFHQDLSGRENIFINGAILGMTIKEIKAKLDSIIDFSEVKAFIDMPVKKYSSGMYLKLAFAIAIHSEADIYLFDEIIAVGDEAFRKKCLEKISDLQKEQKTILFVSHNKQLLYEKSHRVLNISKGSIINQN